MNHETTQALWAIASALERLASAVEDQADADDADDADDDDADWDADWDDEKMGEDE